MEGGGQVENCLDYIGKGEATNNLVVGLLSHEGSTINAPLADRTS